MSTSEPDDFDPPEDLICTNTPMPHNTKKCCEKCWRGVWKDCGKASCPCHTPSLDKSEHDGTCRTPECYEKRPTPAVEKCGCPVPNGIFKQKGRTAWYECSKCGKGIEFTITPTPEKPKHTHITRDFVDGCPACYPPTPAVEDWEGKVKSVFEDLREELTNIDYSEKYILDIVRSLRESDRKRIMEEIKKRQEKLSNYPCDEKHENCSLYGSRMMELESLAKFITNLK